MSSDATYIQPNNKNLTAVFDLTQYAGQDDFRLLDFGCNQGCLCLSFRQHFAPSNYLGIDLNANAISLAKKHFPRFKFIHYNKFHRSYNPHGDPDTRIGDYLNEKFNVIVAYSVFTHCTATETVDTLTELSRWLKPGGKILFTMFLPDALQRMYDCLMRTHDQAVDANHHDRLVTHNFSKILYWIDFDRAVSDTVHTPPAHHVSFMTFYKDVQSILDLAQNITYLGKPAVDNQPQHLFQMVV